MGALTAGTQRTLLRAMDGKHWGGTWLTICTLLCAAATGGCASMYLKGAELTKKPPASHLAVFHAPSCTTTDGQTMAGTQARYVLAAERGTLVLYELDAKGEGSRITNHWQDNDGHHFVSYVQSAQGWHYVVPDAPDQNGARQVYLKGTYSVAKDQGFFRLTGTPSVSCELVLEGHEAKKPPPPPAAPPSATESAAPPPPPPAPSSPPPTACVPGSTQLCHGPGACEGAQQCAMDGSAWGPCDCGKK